MQCALRTPRPTILATHDQRAPSQNHGRKDHVNSGHLSNTDSETHFIKSEPQAEKDLKKQVSSESPGKYLKIAVRFNWPIREAVGATRVEIDLDEPATVGSLIKKLSSTYGEKFRSLVEDPKTTKLSRHIVIFLNDRNILIQESLDTKLKNGDSVLITPVVGGG